MTRRSFCPSRLQQRGISIIMAIFLLLLFASISAFMASLMSTANITAAQDIEGARTYQAARAGSEWGIYQLDPNATGSALPACFGAAVLNQIPGYTVSVSCTPFPGAATAYTEGDRQVRIYQITAIATPVAARPPGVEREVVVTVEKCRTSLVTAVPYDC